MEISDIISLASLLISVTVWVYSWRTRRILDKQQIQINDYTLSQNKKIEENGKKAIVRADAFKTGKGGWRIRVYNSGEGSARNIRIYSADIKAENSGISLMMEQDSFPLLNKGDHFDIVMYLYEGHNPSPIIKFVWDDEFDKDREREQALNLVF